MNYSKLTVEELDAAIDAHNAQRDTLREECQAMAEVRESKRQEAAAVAEAEALLNGSVADTGHVIG